MPSLKKRPSGSFDSVLVHFGPEKAKFHSTHLKLSHTFISVPTAWHFKPLTEVSLDLIVPNKGGKRNALKPIKCHGIIIGCKPLKKKKKSYVVDLLLADLPERYADGFKQLIPVSAQEV